MLVPLKPGDMARTTKRAVVPDNFPLGTKVKIIHIYNGCQNITYYKVIAEKSFYKSRGNRTYAQYLVRENLKKLPPNTKFDAPIEPEFKLDLI